MTCSCGSLRLSCNSWPLQNTRVDSPALQPLIVTTGWRVEYHQFFALEPTLEQVEGHELWFKEDMFQARNEHRNRLLDLGWYPEGNFATGSFGLVLYKGDFHGELLAEFRSKDRAEVVSTINRWFASVSDSEM